jgi:hypothetical protein
MLGLMAAGQAVSGQNDKNVETLIKSARFLEEKPFDKDAKKVRSWAIAWLIETDKVQLQICSLFLRGTDEKYKYSGEITAQHTIGMGAFKLAHPDKAADEGAAQQAAVESVLIAYEAVVKEQPKATNPFLNDLLSKRGDGTLAQFVLANNCKSK